jgi:putative ABC transport system permease protein
LRESYAHQLLSVPGVRAVTPARVIEVKAAPGQFPDEPSENQQYFYFTALDPQSYRQVTDIEFAANQGPVDLSWQRLSQETSVFVSSAFADRYHLHQGDELILLTHRGEQPFTIAAEVIDFGSEGRMLYGTYNDLHRWFSEQGVDRFTLRVAPGYSVQEVADAIEARYGDRWHISLQTTEDFRRDVIGLADQSFRLFDVLSLVGVIIGVLGVINTLTMNVIERRREIGGLRSFGMTRRQVLRMVLAEALALGVMGGLYGQAVGLVIAQALIRGLNLMSGYDLVYRFSARPFLVGAFIALFVVQAAAIFPARRAAHTNIIEAIQHE